MGFKEEDAIKHLAFVMIKAGNIVDGTFVALDNIELKNKDDFCFTPSSDVLHG